MRARTCVTNPRLVPLVRVMTDLETSCERESSTPASPSSLSASAAPRRAQSRALRLRRTKPASVVPSAARSRAMRAHGASAVRRPAGIGRTGCSARVCAQLRRAVRTAGVSAILEATMAPGARVFPFSADIRYIVRCTFHVWHAVSTRAPQRPQELEPVAAMERHTGAGAHERSEGTVGGVWTVRSARVLRHAASASRRGAAARGALLRAAACFVGPRALRKAPPFCVAPCLKSLTCDAGGEALQLAKGAGRALRRAAG